MSVEVTAKLNYLRIGPRKVRLVADLIRGKKAEKAEEILSLSPKNAAKPLLKLLRSALANAKHNNSLEAVVLYVDKITVDGGPVLKRWAPKAHGRAAPIRERTSLINLVLKPLPEKDVTKKNTDKAVVKKTKKSKGIEEEKK